MRDANHGLGLTLPHGGRRLSFGRRRWAGGLLLTSLTMLLAVAPQACTATEDVVLVLAAASTIDAMEAAVADFNGEGAPRIEVSFGPTSVVARQLEEGAPADLVLLASAAWADYLQDRVALAARDALVGNELAVVASANLEPSAMSWDAALTEPRHTRIAIADPASVPAGIYATEALHRAALWDAVQPRLIPTIDVRAALRLVADGEADIGIVYATDAAATPRVRIIARIDPRLHQRIEYPLLLLANAPPEAQRFYEYLLSARGRAHFHDRGFIDAGR